MEVRVGYGKQAREIFRLSGLDLDDYPRRIVDLEEHTEDWRTRRALKAVHEGRHPPPPIK